MTTEHRLSPLGHAKVGQLIDEYLAVSAIRDRRLFDTFLCTGYERTSLSSVESKNFDDALFAKMHVGMLITLYDDLADNPRHRDPELLERLYHLNVDRGLSAVSAEIGGDARSKIHSLARTMFGRLRDLVGELPNGESLLPVLAFDIEQFYQANRYAELISGLPEIGNLDEARVLEPHNMGAVAIGTIDLMATRELNLAELGRCREVFLLGQRVGRISNVLATYERELGEGDRTNEIMIAARAAPADSYKRALVEELERLIAEIEANERKVTTFDVREYASGLRRLHELHMALRGII